MTSVFQQRLKRYVRRHRIQVAWIRSQWIFFCWCCLMLVLSSLHHIFFIPEIWPDALIFSGALLGPVLLLTLVWRMPARMNTIQLVDSKGQLKNLIYAAATIPEDHPAASILCDEAISALDSLSPKKLFPLRARWPAKASLILLPVLYLSFFLPQWDVMGRQEIWFARQKLEKQKKEITSRLEKHIRQLSQLPQHKLSAQDKKLLRLLKEEVQAFKNVRNRKELLKQLQEYTQKLSKLEEQPSQQSRKTQLATSNTIKKIQKSLEQLANQQLNPQERKQLQEKLRRQIQQLTQQKNSQIPSETLRRLDQLSKAEQQPEKIPELARQLKHDLDKLSDRQRTPTSFEREKVWNDLNDFRRQVIGRKAAPLGLRKEKVAKNSRPSNRKSSKNAQVCKKRRKRETKSGNKVCDQCKNEGGTKSETLAKGKNSAAGKRTGIVNRGNSPGKTGKIAQSSQAGRGKGSGPRGETPDKVGFRDRQTNIEIQKGKHTVTSGGYGAPSLTGDPVEHPQQLKLARQEAERQLQQQKIPREYQRIVKNYFDQLTPAKSPEE
ncbi:MAG: hypothetical protein D6820_13600 [Lentisphaerae bacterium]|nr:MAG: hypothetical protein D6820_13600 [Lentisphaerota bacterium]